MKVAILMASYNGERYICEQIDSITSQTYSNWVLYINDDGSTDGTIDIIKEYISKYPDKICLSYNDSGKCGATGNFADLFQKVPQADWYVLCDQDDIWPNDRLEKMLQKAVTEGVSDNSDIPAIVYGRAQVVDENLNKLGNSIEECLYVKLREEIAHKQILLATYIWGCTMMYNDALRNLVKVIPQGALYHDAYLEIVCVYFGKIVALEDIVVKYRQHGNNVSAGVYPLYIDIFRRLKCMRGIMNRIRSLRDGIKLQIETFFEQFNERFSKEDRLQILNCIEILEYKSRIHSVFSAIQKRYLGWNGYYKYITFLFIVKGKVRGKDTNQE